MGAGGTVGGFAGAAGFAGTSVAGSGGQTSCPPEPSGVIPRCAYGFIDADADGYGDPARPHACCGDAVTPLMTDCDDKDPTRARTAFPDHDGDGRGAGVALCSTNPPPAGFAFPSGDCDDENPQIDWEGTSDCPCERFLFEPAVSANPSCASSPDLFVVDHEVCALNCGQWLAFRVGNAGGVAAEGPITVSMTVRSEEASLTLETLAPGAASGWRKVPLVGFTGPATISLASSNGACAESRPTFETELAMSCEP